MSDFVSKLMLLSTLGIILPVFAGEGRRINVVGTAQLRAFPNQADVYLSAEATQPKVKTSLDQVQSALRGAFAVCSKYALDSADIAAGGVSVEKEYRWVKNTQVFAGYHASQTLTLRLKDMGRLGALMEELSLGKLTRISGIYYGHSAMDSLERAAESKAMVNARSTAEALAKISGGVAGAALVIGNGMPADFSMGEQSGGMDGMVSRASNFEPKAKAPYLVKPDQIEVLGRVFAAYELLPAKSRP
jgi:uncharacterized protein